MAEITVAITRVEIPPSTVTYVYIAKLNNAAKARGEESGALAALNGARDATISLIPAGHEAYEIELITRTRPSSEG